MKSSRLHRCFLSHLVSFLAVMFLFPGCTMPDYWYDHQENIFQAHEELEKITGVEQSLLPGPTMEHPPPLPESEQSTITLSIEQTVFLALSGNRNLQVERYGPVIAGAFEKIERGVYDPELFSEFIYAKETASETSRGTGERFSVKARDAEITAGLRQQLPTGTELEASITHFGSTSNRTPEQQEFRLGMSITQSILAGLGPAVNLVTIHQAQLETRISHYQLRGFVEALAAEVEIAYWRFVLANEGIAIFKSSLEIARQQLDEVEKRIEVGVLPRNAAAAAKAEVARREQALLEAYSIHEERRLRLLRLLNIPGTEQFGLTVRPSSLPRTAVTPLSDLSDRLELADRMRADLNEARLRKVQRQLEIVRTRNGLLPKLDLFINFGKTGYAESFSEAFKDLDGDNYNLTAGFQFSKHLGNREAEGQDLAARTSLSQANAAIENMRNLIELDVRLAINETERARKQIEASAVTRMYQEQTLQAEQERFAIGTSTSLQIGQAQRDMLVSQLAEIESIIAYRIALVNLYLVEGSLLERRGVQLAVNN